MPPKIRELIAEPERNGFTNRGGKGSHRNYEHFSGFRVTISGKTGDDARKYQEQLVKNAIEKVKGEMKSPADVYEKVVVWSEEDQVFIGMCPELFHGGVHGDDPIEVFKELCEAVDEWVEIFRQDGKPLPAPKNAVLKAA